MKNEQQGAFQVNFLLHEFKKHKEKHSFDQENGSVVRQNHVL